MVFRNVWAYGRAMLHEHLPSALARALETRGYETLTEVQDAVSKAEAVGRDLLVSARTGSGKTVAFGLAMADRPARRGGAAAVCARSRWRW